MQNIQFPLSLTFKIGTLHNDFIAVDASGKTVAFARQKMLKLKEHIQIFSDDSKSEVLYNIRADKWIDWSTAYKFTDASGTNIGKIARKGWRSIWKASYDIIDQNDKFQYKVREESPWVKVADSLLGEIPIVGMLTGYLFNPSYLVSDENDNEIARLKKEPSFFGRKFTIEKIGTLDNDDDDRILLGLMMMILLERRRG